MTPDHKLRESIISASDAAISLALRVDQLADQIAESPICFAALLKNVTGDSEMPDDGAVALWHRAIRSHSLLVTALKNLRTAIARAEATARTEGQK